MGSTALAANGTTGALISEQRYKPWGEQRYPAGASSLPTRHRFTGQIDDSEIGLYFYGARYYSSVLGRFLSADTIVPNPSDPQQLNRYAYTRNNPVKYIDPSGHAAVCGLTGEGCEISYLPHPVTQSSPDGVNNAWNFATGLVVMVASVAWEPVDTAVSAVQCLGGDGWACAGAAIPFVSGAMAKGGAKILGLADDVPVGAADEAVESLTDAGKAAENAVENSGSATAALHKNSLDYVGETHVYRIKGSDGTTYKIGQSARGVREVDGASIRAEQQVRRLRKTTGQQYASEIRKTFPNKRSAYEYENRLIERFRRMYGEDSLPGNLNNH